MTAYGAGPATSDLVNDAATPGDITTYGGGYDLQRHSPLKQINRDNVKRMVPVWNLSLANNYPQEGQPLLIDGVMYETTTDATVAIDPLTGKQLWRPGLLYDEAQTSADVFPTQTKFSKPFARVSSVPLSHHIDFSNFC